MIKNRTVSVLALVVIAASALAANLKDESLGGFKLGDGVKIVTDKLGKPAEKKGPRYAGEATADWYFSYRYPAQGLDLVFVGPSKQAKETELRLGEVRAYGPSIAKTSKGIGPGSTKAEVKNAYGAAEDIIDEEQWCGLYISYQGDKVSELSLSSIKMPE